MDEILIANFMVFHDVVREDGYDLWIGDEAWELDYYLHENPNEKRAPFAWLTDFVGWLPMADGGARPRRRSPATTTLKMIEHISDNAPTLRDRALFVGNLEDVVGDRLPPQAPADPRLDARRTSSFPATSPASFAAAPEAERRQLRAQLGYRADERVSGE